MTEAVTLAETALLEYIFYDGSNEGQLTRWFTAIDFAMSVWAYANSYSLIYRSNIPTSRPPLLVSLGQYFVVDRSTGTAMILNSIERVYPTPVDVSINY